MSRNRIVILSSAAILVALCLPGTAAAADSPLSAYWPLNEGKGQVVRDWSGNGNNGQLGSTASADANDPSWIKGLWFWSSALHFDGDDFVTIPDSNSLEPQQMTVSAWFRGTGSPGRFRYLVAKGSNLCQNASYGLYTGTGGGIAFYVSSLDYGGWTRSPEAADSIWDGKWHNASGSWDGSTVRLFIDGKESAAAARPRRPPTTARRAATARSAVTAAGSATWRSSATSTRSRSGTRHCPSATSGSARRCSSLRTESR